MMPMYMNSSQPSQMGAQGHYHGYPNHPHPHPHHMSMDASSPASCEHWPAPHPSPCYGNCIHGNFPVYNNAYLPPCYPPQVPYRPCCMNHSGFQPHVYHAPPCYTHQPFPVGYQHLCTQCSSPMSYPKNDRGVVIEEHGPEIEKENQGELPVRSTSCAYPIVRIPNENARSQEHGSSRGSRSCDQPTAEVKAPQNMEVQKRDPKCWNGYFPFDESTMKSLIQNQDRKKLPEGKTVELPFDISKLKSFLQGLDGKDQMNKQESGQLPYPILWIPSHEKQDVEASKSMERSNEERNSKSSPSDPLNEGQNSEHKGKEGNFENNLLLNAEEKSSIRNIPVKNHLKEPRIIPVKQSDSHLQKPTEPTKSIAKTKPVENAQKQQPSSSPKASKLPPVCLRVDPLPRRKSGGSKSLSPPRRKEQPLSSEETKVKSPPRSKNAETKTAPETCNLKCEEASKEKMPKGRVNSTEPEKESVEKSNSNLQKRASSEIVEPCEIKENREKPPKKTFTEEEAARMIQCWYRGYDVRRWDPIKKLKEIANVREQTGNVKRRIQALGVSSEHIEEKEIVILGEMVMSLLLKLDSVQGLHPSIRDYRKSLARELSDIQEKLDSLRKSSVEKKVVVEQVETTLQTSDCPVNLEHSQLADEENMVSESNVLPASPEEHPMNTTDKQLVTEQEEEAKLPMTETCICDAVATSTVIPEKIEGVLPADGNEMTVAVTDIEEDKFIVEKLEEPSHECPQVMETSQGVGFKGPENGTDNLSENENRKEDNDTVVLLPPEKDVELSELPVEVIDDEMQLLSQDSTCVRESKTTAMDPETVMLEETNVDYSADDSKGTCEPQDEFVEDKISEETKKLMEETNVDQPLETEAVEQETPEETKKLMEETNVDQQSETEAVKQEIPQETKKVMEETNVDQPSETEAFEQETLKETQKLKEETNVDQSSETEAVEQEIPEETHKLMEETNVDQPSETEAVEQEITEETKKLMEENQRYKETMETLVKAGREQLEVISKLTGRVKSLEKKLSKNKRAQIRRRKSRRAKHATNPMSEIYTDTLL